MKGIRITFIVFFCLTAWGAKCLGHGARCTVLEGATGIEAVYDNGSPMAFCDVSVFSPANGDSIFMTGSTDKYGHYFFCPDQDGTWKVTVDDGMGHLAGVKIDVKSGSISGDGRVGGVNRIWGSLIGISVIFGLFGLYSLFLRKRAKTGERSGTRKGGA